MSAAFDRGRDAEREVAALMRRKLGARVVRDKQSGAGINKSDISDYFGETRLAVEVKDQQTLKIKEWMRQAQAAASAGQIPTLAFRMESDLMACIPFDELLNLLAEIKDLRKEVNTLRTPMPVDEGVRKLANTFRPDSRNVVVAARAFGKQAAAKLAAEAAGKKIARGATTCRNGHLTDDFGYCLQNKCPFSRGYKAPKAKAYGK